MQIGALLAALAAASAASADTIDVNGVKRSYTAQLPAKRLVPLVVVLHGKTQRGADMVARTAWPQVAKREGFAVVFPDGLNHAWADARTKAGPALRGPPEGTDDVAFIAKLVETLVTNGTADPKRVYVAGISNGGAMAMTLVCARADLFAAGASVIMNLTDEAAVTCSSTARPTRWSPTREDGDRAIMPQTGSGPPKRRWLSGASSMVARPTTPR
jgi:polyhydroxybutyrate depolymerase